jgi:ribosomal protein S25
VHRSFHDRLRQGVGSVRLAAIVDGLFVNPVAIATRVAERHGVTYPTARSDLRRLHQKGIIQPLDDARQIAYYCPDILEITYAD